LSNLAETLIVLYDAIIPMKFPVLAVLLLSAVLTHLGNAAVVPVSEDTAAANGKIVKTAGAAAVLPLSTGGEAQALLRFDVAGFSGLIPAANVHSAFLVFNVAKVKKQGELRVHRVLSEWAEAAGGTRAAPTFDPVPLSVIPADSVRVQQFTMIDVTDQVKQWLAEPSTDFGFAITGDGGTALEICAKEGPSAGQPAWIEIERIATTGNDQISAGVDAAKIGVGSVSNEEFSSLDGVNAPIQTQLNSAVSGALKTEESEPSLRIVRGTLLRKNGALTVRDGSGFTVTSISSEDYVIHFNQAFSANPTVTISYGNAPTQTNYHLSFGLAEVTPSSFAFHGQISGEDRTLHFIAIGPR
jgi:hypothetical protein